MHSQVAEGDSSPLEVAARFLQQQIRMAGRVVAAAVALLMVGWYALHGFGRPGIHLIQAGNLLVLAVCLWILGAPGFAAAPAGDGDGRICRHRPGDRCLRHRGEGQRHDDRGPARHGPRQRHADLLGRRHAARRRPPPGRHRGRCLLRRGGRAGPAARSSSPAPTCRRSRRPSTSPSSSSATTSGACGITSIDSRGRTPCARASSASVPYSRATRIGIALDRPVGPHRTSEHVTGSACSDTRPGSCPGFPTRRYPTRTTSSRCERLSARPCRVGGRTFAA